LDLPHDINAITVILYHFAHCSYLSFNFGEPCIGAALGITSHVTIPGGVSIEGGLYTPAGYISKRLLGHRAVAVAEVKNDYSGELIEPHTQEKRGVFMDGHPVAYSRRVITELMVPSYANFGGKVHGGTLMSLMDKLAYVCASKHAGNYCVTVSVDNVQFLQPVEVGEVVSLMGSVNYVGRKSLVVGIKVTAENLQEGMSKHTNTCYFTMVAKGADGKTATVPPLVLESEEEVRRFCSALQRRRIREEGVAFMNHYKSSFTNDEAELNLLSDERCVLAIRPE